MKTILKLAQYALWSAFAFVCGVSANAASWDKNEFVKYLATYHLGSFERDFDLLNKSDKYALGDLAKLESAYILIGQGKIADAKNILSTIPQDSQLIEIARILTHSTITKKEANPKDLAQDLGESNAKDSGDSGESSGESNADSSANQKDSPESSTDSNKSKGESQ